MSIKRIMCAVLAAVMTLSFTACKSGSDNKKKTEGNTETKAAETTFVDDDANYEPLKLDSNLDYGGATVRLLTEYDNEYYGIDEESGMEFENYYAGELTVEDLTNEPVNDSVYNREIYVEDLLNVELERTQTPKGYSVRQYVETMFNSGDTAGEIITAPCAGTMWSSQYGFYLDLNEVDNLDLTSPWWNQDFNSESSFGFNNYFVTGDMSLTLLRSTNVLFYNKKIANDNGLEDVYKIILDGKWTLDKLTELSSEIYIDANGNSLKDEEDVFGLMAASMTADPLWSSFEIDILSKDSDDYLVYSPDMEKFGIAFKKVFSLFESNSTYTGPSDGTWEPTDGIYKYFAEDKALFASSLLVKVETDIMRNMQSEYGIIPLPKYDEAQKNYYTMAVDQYTVFGIMATMNGADAAMAGAVLEAMGWYSYRYVVPTYLNIAMKGKYANDTETRQMLDIIVDGIRVDAAWIYAYFLDDYPQEWRYLLGQHDENYASAYQRKERNIKILVKSLNESYRKLIEG